MRRTLCGLAVVVAAVAVGGCATPAVRPGSSKVAFATLEENACKAMPAGTLQQAIGDAATSAGLTHLRLTDKPDNRYSGDLVQCRYDFAAETTVPPSPAPSDDVPDEAQPPEEPPPPPSAPASSRPPSLLYGNVTFYNEKTGGAPLMAACRTSDNPGVGDQSCVDGEGQVHVRLGDHYFTLYAKMSPSRDRTAALQQNRAIALAAARAYAARLTP